MVDHAGGPAVISFIIILYYIILAELVWDLPLSLIRKVGGRLSFSTEWHVISVGGIWLYHRAQISSVFDGPQSANILVLLYAVVDIDQSLPIYGKLL